MNNELKLPPKPACDHFDDLRMLWDAASMDAYALAAIELNRAALAQQQEGDAVQEPFGYIATTHDGKHIRFYTNDVWTAQRFTAENGIDCRAAYLGPIATTEDDPIGWFSLEAMGNIKWREGLAVCDFEEGQPFYESPQSAPVETREQIRDAAKTVAWMVVVNGVCAGVFRHKIDARSVGFESVGFDEKKRFDLVPLCVNVAAISAKESEHG